MKALRFYLINIILICTLSSISFAQVRGFDTFPDDDEIEKSELKERYRSLDLHWYEWLCMAAGVALFVLARKFEYTNETLYKTLTVASVIIGFPLIYLVVTLVASAISAILVLLIMYGILSAIFKK